MVPRDSRVEKEMAAHFSILAWRIPGIGEPGGLPSTGSHRVGHDLSNLAAAAKTAEGRRKEEAESEQVENPTQVSSLASRMLS